METYFELVPSELLTLIAYYLDVNDIRNIIESEGTIKPMKHIIKNKFFWINKSEYDNIGVKYLKFLDIVENNNISNFKNTYSIIYNINKGDFITAYDKLIDLEMNIGPLVDAMYRYRVTMSLNLKSDTSIKDLISTLDLEKMNKMI